MSENKTRKATVALYRANGTGTEIILEYIPYYEEAHDYTRVSSPVTVEFPPCTADDMIMMEINAINNQIDRISIDANEKMTELTKRKNELKKQLNNKYEETK